MTYFGKYAIYMLLLPCPERILVSQPKQGAPWGFWCSKNEEKITCNKTGPVVLLLLRRGSGRKVRMLPPNAARCFVDFSVSISKTAGLQQFAIVCVFLQTSFDWHGNTLANILLLIWERDGMLFLLVSSWPLYKGCFAVCTYPLRFQ